MIDKQREMMSRRRAVRCTGDGDPRCARRLGLWPSSTRVPCRRAGFSMLELTVAIAVLLLGTLAAFGTQVTSFRLIDSSRSSTVAATDLEMAMEELLLQSATDMPAIYPPDAPIPSFTGLHLEREVITPTYPGYTVGGPVPDPLEIVLEASWLDDRGRPQRQRLVTAKSR